jgi:hypothetical protein
MGGQHWMDLQFTECRHHGISAYAGNCRSERVLRRGRARAVASAQHSDPVPFLGEVHQMEQDGERVRDLVGAFDGHRVDETPWLAQVPAAARIPGGPTQPFDVVVQICATGLGDNLAEQPDEEPDVVVQRRELVRPLGRHDQRA